MSRYTPGPWELCRDGECPCKIVSAENGPVCKVTSGLWGDTYPSLRIVEDGIDKKIEPYTELIPYGEVSEETAIANGILISKAPDIYEALKEIISAWDAPFYGEDEDRIDFLYESTIKARELLLDIHSKLSPEV